MNVSVTLTLVDRLTRQVRTVRDSLRELTRSATDLQRAFGGSSSVGGNFARLTSQARAVGQEVLSLTRDFNTLGSAMNRGGGANTFGRRQVSDLQQVLSLQRQVIANNGRMMMAGPGGPGGRVPNVPGTSGFWGRRGFSPNSSIMDRAQYRGVNLAEQSFAMGALDLDRARTQLLMLANPRRDPANPDNLLPGVISPEVVAQIEAEAVVLTRQFRALNRSHVLDTFRELAPQFANVEDAFALLPRMLSIQEWQILQGDTVEQARGGMLSLLRAIGLSGRLIDNEGRLKEDETGAFLDNYLRARMIGGRDVTPEQVFQVMKYLKTTGQTLNQEAPLTAFVGMPDMRGSTFGNTLDQLRIQLQGRATQAAQAALEAGGLGTRGERTQSGPHGFTPVDPVLLNENIFAWFDRHILGPTGYLRRQGIDYVNASPAEISAALRPLFSRATVENMANAIVHQQAEWRTQVGHARRFNLTDEARLGLGSQSTWFQLMAARSKLQDVLASVAESFKLLLPHLEKITDKAGQIAAFMDPQVGNPIAGMGLLGSAGLAALIMGRRMMGGMGRLGRTLLGGGLGFLLGGVPGVLTGGMLMRGFAASPAAGAAATAVGMTWGRRILAGLRSIIMRGIPGFLLLTGVIHAIEQIADNWETVSAHLKAVWADLQRAWESGTWNAILRGTSPGMAQINQDLNNLTRPTALWIEDLLRGTEIGQALYARGAIRSLLSPEQARLDADARAMAGMGFYGTPPAQDLTRAVGKPGVTTVTVTGNPITINITTPAGASPQAIGEAAGNAVGSQLRAPLGDTPGQPH